MINAIKFASVPVSDQDRALEFYKDKLGFSVLTDQPLSDDQRWIELGIDGAETRLVLFTMADHKDRIGTPQHVTFACDSVEKTYQILSEKGVEFEGKPKQMPWGTFATFKDPDGNSFVLATR